MRQSRFSETQIVSTLKEAEAGRGHRSVSRARHEFRDLLQVEGQLQ